MLFDNILNWHNHIEKICAKISQQLGLLQRIKFCIPNVTLRYWSDVCSGATCHKGNGISNGKNDYLSPFF